MTSEALSLVAGLILSLIFTYLPGIRESWAELEASKKQQYMAILLVVVAVGATVLSCFNVIVAITCTQNDIVTFFMRVVVNAVLALSANQSVYQITKPKPVVTYS